MPNKIRLNTGQEFELVGYGYMKDDIRKEVQFRFSSELNIGEIQAFFKNTQAISKIEYLLEDGSIQDVITDCAVYQSITQDSEGKYIVTLSTDKISTELKRVQEELQTTREQVDNLTIALAQIMGV